MQNAIKWAFKDLTDTGVLVAGVPGKIIRVFSFIIVVNANVTARFRSGSTSISAGFPFAANGGVSAAKTDHPWFETAAGEDLSLLLSVPAVAAVQLTYSQD